MNNITKAQYVSALNEEGVLRDRSLELLTVLFDAPSCRATAGQIAEIFGYENFPPVNALIGQLGKRIAHHLQIELPERPNNSRGWWQIVATGEHIEEGFAWSLRDELFDALVELNLLSDRDSLLFPDTVPETGLYEGASRSVAINAYERNQTARTICIQHHGVFCAACDFDFQKVYGAIGLGIISVSCQKLPRNIRSIL